MKLSLRLIASLVFSISLLTFLVARNQVRSQKSGMRGDLARRAEVLTESLQETVEPVLQKGPTQLRRIVERFGDRQHLAGVAIYDPDGKLLAQDDDGGGYPDARIVHKAAKTGKYRVIASHFGNGGNLGEFTITVRHTSGEPGMNIRKDGAPFKDAK